MPIPSVDPIPLAEVSAPGRQWTAMGQKEINSHLTALLASESSVDDFVLSSIADIDARGHRRAQMEKTAHLFDHPHEVLLGTDKLKGK